MLRPALPVCVLTAALLAPIAAAAQPAPATGQQPGWFSLKGESRVRYETLNGQFRAGGTGGDQVLALRTLVLGEARLARFGLEAVTLGLELQDSRYLGDDAGTPLSNGNVNALDVLQAYASIDLDGAFGHTDATLKLGRQTLDIGSRRVLERVDMANVILAYTGAYWRSVNVRGDEWHGVLVAPVGRRPADRPSLDSNEIQADREEWGRTLVGIHYRDRNALGPALPDTWVEGFLYRLQERDTEQVATPNRDYWQPGFRVFRSPREGRSDFEIEASWRGGSRRASAAATDTRDLDVDAWTVHAHWAWTFTSDWNWRVGVDYDFASGDRDPGDGRFGQFERLFGGRRTDLGNTGIFGPLTPANIIAPGARVEFSPPGLLDIRVSWKHAWLASATDIWPDARLRDTTGRSGRFIGDVFDARVRSWVVRDRLLAEVGASALLPGRFATTAPGAPDYDRSHFGYVSLTTSF